MTTGASWKSEDAGPNRILRWVMLLDENILETNYDIPMSTFSPVIKAKLREKGASYDDCLNCARKLTVLAYNMDGSPQMPESLRHYFHSLEYITTDKTTCMVCKEPLSYDDFMKAKRGKAVLETSHASPRLHNKENVGFAHRDCNIAQGSRTLDEFYSWIHGILQRNSIV